MGLGKPGFTRFQFRPERAPQADGLDIRASKKKSEKAGPAVLPLSRYKVSLKSNHSGGKRDEKHS
jgi:hypothetical protein